MDIKALLNLYSEQLSSSNPWVLLNDSAQVILATNSYLELLHNVNDRNLDNGLKLPFCELPSDIKALDGKHIISVLRGVYLKEKTVFYQIVIRKVEINSKNVFAITFIEVGD